LFRRRCRYTFLTAALITSLLTAGGCGAGAGGPIAVTFDPCQPVRVGLEAASADQTASLDDAIAMWRAQGLGGLERASSQDVDLTLRFQTAAGNFHGLYDGANATIYINQALDDRHARAVTIAHELGHAYGLLHVDADERRSVMNRANLTVEPTAADEQAIAALWGRCR
jgi:hypothetical protein